MLTLGPASQGTEKGRKWVCGKTEGEERKTNTEIHWTPLSALCEADSIGLNRTTWTNSIRAAYSQATVIGWFRDGHMTEVSQSRLEGHNMSRDFVGATEETDSLSCRNWCRGTRNNCEEWS